MFKWLESRVLWGSLLILAGLVFLIQNFFNLQLGGLFWAALLALGGLAFISVYLGDHRHWWGLIPGFTLLGISATVFASNFFPRLDNILGGLFVLGGIGLAFTAVYLADRRNWWAVIPAGVLFTLAVISVFDQVLRGFDSGGLLFLGLALTFALVALLPNPPGRMTWAWYPAAILAVIGLIISAASENLLGYLWPLVLILGGLVLIFRTVIARRG
jgi:hypothetical protein